MSGVKGQGRLPISASTVARMYRAGMEATEVASRFGCDASTVYKRLREAGVSASRTTRGRTFPQRHRVDRKEAAHRYSRGESSTQIAKALNVSTSAVLNALHREGVTIRDKYHSVRLRHKGNRSVSSHGYVRINTGDGKRRYEHDLIAERVLGRRLRAGEVVHHINGDPADNRNANLLICTRQYHLALHKRIRERYGKDNYPFRVGDQSTQDNRSDL